MKPIPVTPETLAIACRVIWFEPAEKAMSDPVRFMAYAMMYALPEDMCVIRTDALDHAPPGIIGAHSWAYWNAKLGRYPRPHPVRTFGEPVDERRPDIKMQRRYGASAWLRELDGSLESDFEDKPSL